MCLQFDLVALISLLLYILLAVVIELIDKIDSRPVVVCLLLDVLE